jgi:hypothetical protein
MIPALRRPARRRFRFTITLEVPMARRTGKAATRRARQQRRARMGPAAPATAPTPIESADATPGGGGESRPAPPRQPLFAAVPTGSRLGENAREEYHYVGRDLRNTAILSLIMAALLAGAVALVNLAGIASS